MAVYETSFSQSTAPLDMGREGLRKQAEELESVFLNTLVSEMFSGMDDENQFGGGYAQQTWRSMQSEQFAASLAKSGGIGIADQIMSNLLAAQEAAQSIAGSPTGQAAAYAVPNHSTQGSNQ